MLFGQITPRLTLALTLAISGVGQSSAQDENVMRGFVSASCGRFLTSSMELKDDKDWIRLWNVASASFLSGINIAYAAGKNRPAMKVLPDGESFYWELKNRCSNSPQEGVADVLVDLWRELPTVKN